MPCITTSCSSSASIESSLGSVEGRQSPTLGHMALSLFSPLLPKTWLVNFTFPLTLLLSFRPARRQSVSMPEPWRQERLQAL